jgi:hypothetical protein
MSIVRFQIDTFNLPSLIFQVENNQADRDLGIYTLTLEYDDGVGGITTTNPEPVMWIPQTSNAPLPNPPSLTGTGFQEFSDYYFCHDFQYMIDLINTAFDNAMTALIAAVAPVLNTVEPPFLAWNKDKTATLYARESHFDSDAAAKVKIYFNRPLYSLFNSFPAWKFTPPVTEKKYYEIQVKRYLGEKVITLPEFGIDKLIRVEQEFSTISQWTPVSSVMFTTSTIPIIPNQLSNPVIYLDGGPIQLNQTYKNFSNIISDISTDECVYKPELLFVPSAEYRRIDLQNDQPLTQIDIQVFWKDKLGFIRPFTLPPNASCSMKILFEKKTKTVAPERKGTLF